MIKGKLMLSSSVNYRTIIDCMLQRCCSIVHASLQKTAHTPPAGCYLPSPAAHSPEFGSGSQREKKKKLKVCTGHIYF